MELDIQVSESHPLLTKKEKVILQLRAMGLTKREMAERLHRSVATIVTHDMHMREKLGATNAAQAVSFSIAMGILTIAASQPDGVPASKSEKRVIGRATSVLMLLLSLVGLAPSPDVMASDWLSKGHEQPFQRVRGGVRGRVRTGASGRSASRKRDEFEPGVFDVR
jgi:DNA-binding CsgD family transcriptional regulator